MIAAVGDRDLLIDPDRAFSGGPGRDGRGANNVGTPAAESFLVRDRLPVDLTHRPDPDQSSVPPFVIPDQLSPTVGYARYAH